MNRLQRLQAAIKAKAEATNGKATSSDNNMSPSHNGHSFSTKPASSLEIIPECSKNLENEIESSSKRPVNHEDDLGEFDRWNPMSEDFESNKNTLTLNPNSDPLTFTTGKLQPIGSKIGNVIICEHFANFGECADGRFCDRLHVDPRAREKIWTLQETYESNKGRTCMNFTYLSPIEVEINPKKLLLVSIASVTSPSSFYVVAPFENLDFACLNKSEIDFYVNRIQQTSGIKKKIEHFHQQMADIFDHTYRVDNLNDEIYLSQIVACKLKNGHFRRAMVIGLPDIYDEADINYKLLLIDIGVEVELPRELIYDIKAKTLSEPPLAYNCRLDMRPARGELRWSEAALSQFRSLVRQNRFSLCQVKQHIKADRILTVDLLDLNTRVSYTEKMFEYGFAESCGR